MRSHLLVGKVRHRRARPFTYGLEHDVWYAALDLAELDQLERSSRLFRRNRRGAAVFRDRDHLPTPAQEIAADLAAHLRSEGTDPAGWRITLVTNLRVLGYVFNPASFFLCRDGAGVLRVVVVEVHNTFGGRHLYTLRQPDRAEDAAPFLGAMPKQFFVSPFISADGGYAVHVADEPSELKIAIALRQDGEHLLSTSLVLSRRRWTDRNLLRLLLRYPAMSHKTIGFILWHALRLKLKGAPFFRHSAWKRAQEGRS